MTGTFVDTSFLIASLRVSDELHERALGWQRAASPPLVTTEYVLVELLDALTSPPVRAAAASAVEVFRRKRVMRIVPASTALLDEGISWFATHAAKRWSLTDCISFVVMRREGIIDALTNDHHFEQAGFRALLRSCPS